MWRKSFAPKKKSDLRSRQLYKWKNLQREVEDDRSFEKKRNSCHQIDDDLVLFVAIGGFYRAKKEWIKKEEKNGHCHWTLTIDGNRSHFTIRQRHEVSLCNICETIQQKEKKNQHQPKQENDAWRIVTMKNANENNHLTCWVNGRLALNVACDQVTIKTRDLVAFRNS